MPGNRRLRGKQARPHPPLCEAPRAAQLHRLFHFEELSHLVTSWLGQRSLCRLALADAARRALAADPEAWRGRRLELRSRAIRNSSQLSKVLAVSLGRWALVRSLVFPRCNPSTAATPEEIEARRQKEAEESKAKWTQTTMLVFHERVVQVLGFGPHR